MVGSWRVPEQVTAIIAAFVQALGKNQLTAYLVEMTIRLVELRRVLKDTGSLYLHCDPTASHYLKIVLDAIFGTNGFLAEIVWKRTTTHNDAKKWSPDHDVILVYTVSADFTFNPVYMPHDQSYVDTFYRHVDDKGRRYRLDNIASPNPRPNLTYVWRGNEPPSKGWRYSLDTMERLFAEGRIELPRKTGGRPQVRRYLDEMKGTPPGDLWNDISPIGAQAAERLGYPTQKPLALLERIISASSNPGDIVLDPFCGCGTAVAAAQKLGRQWIGIDLTYLSIAVMKKRLQDHFPELGKIEVVGAPTELEGARRLAEDEENGRYQFQWWALDQIGATPRGGDKKKGADGGIDGIITFSDVGGSLQSVIVSVKSGGVQASDVRDLKAVVDREKAAIGVLVTLVAPTKPMRDEAVQAGTWRSELYDKEHRKIQIITAREILEEGKKPDLPALIAEQYRKAERIATKEGEQGELF